MKILIDTNGYDNYWVITASFSVNTPWSIERERRALAAIVQHDPEIRNRDFTIPESVYRIEWNDAWQSLMVRVVSHQPECPHMDVVLAVIRDAEKRITAAVERMREYLARQEIKNAMDPVPLAA